MISPRTVIPPKQIGDWHHIGAVWDESTRKMLQALAQGEYMSEPWTKGNRAL